MINGNTKSFSDRMALAKAIKADAAYKGKSSGQHSSWNFKYSNRNYDELTKWDFLVKRVRGAWASDKREILNQFQADCLNMHDNPNTWVW